MSLSASFSTSRLRDNSSEEDVQFLYQVPSESVVCQICSRNLDHSTLDERNAHYETHFEGGSGASSSSTPSNESPKSSIRAKTLSKARHLFSHGLHKEPKEDVFWYTSKAGSPPDNYTPALIPILKTHLRKSRNTQRAWLCAENAVHITVESWDRGWGCGYRNFLMAASALMSQTQQPMYFPLLDSPVSPGVRKLQTWIEDAWRFDKAGAQELRNKLTDTTKWIGTAELWVAFTSRGVPSHLVDFQIDVKEDIEVLIAWIENYFSEDAPQQSQNAHEVLLRASPVTVTNKMPIILQHHGHSRTIVGFERCENGSINLLEFNPSRTVPPDIRNAALSSRRSNLSAFNRAGQKRPASRNLKGPIKRMRSGTQHDAIIIDSDNDQDDIQTVVNHGRSPTEEANTSSVGTAQLLKVFRLPARSLHHKKYQILYFPLSAPLTDKERLDRRVVMSFKVQRGT